MRDNQPKPPEGALCDVLRFFKPLFTGFYEIVKYKKCVLGSI